MKWSLILFVLFSLPSFAEVSRDRVGTILDQMVRENIISPAEAEKAKLRMKNMNTDQWSQLTTEATTVANRLPASVGTLSNDLDGAQFQAITNEAKRIMPKN